ncbi:MAG: mechanosensitive ion channel family protein [Candidatus Handelsmanbacteria bacterium]|nr:mechanosensitive ion channel family protein [Candidatus Handelsmanbacteria bacterium]
MLESIAEPVAYLQYQGPIMGVATLTILWVAYKLSSRGLGRYLSSRGEYKVENVQHFLFIWRYLWLGLGAILGIISFSGSLATLGISAAFLGMVLGWSLQAPVTGIAAWLMIILKQPFKIGDRVIIAGIIGDVVDITLTHVLLNQVGGTIGGEEKSGRGVLIPNATLFQQIIYNYTLDGGPETAEVASSYILDEVPVRLTYGSDFDEAEKILIGAARQITGEIVRHTGQEPFVRAELFESGILLRLRYQTLGKERQRISSDIVRVIIREFGRTSKVNFCYPHMDIYYTPRQK